MEAVFSRYGKVFKIGHLLPTSVKGSLHYSLFPTLGNYRLQKKVVRSIAFKNFTSPSTPIFSELKILKLYDLFHLKLLTFVYESVRLISPTFFHNFLEILTSVSQYDTVQDRLTKMIFLWHIRILSSMD